MPDDADELILKMQHLEAQARAEQDAHVAAPLRDLLDREEPVAVRGHGAQAAELRVRIHHGGFHSFGGWQQVGRVVER